MDTAYTPYYQNKEIKIQKTTLLPYAEKENSQSTKPKGQENTEHFHRKQGFTTVTKI